MKFVKHKVYWNYEKEERWLNEQAAKGYALVDYSWCRYVFEESEPGEYTYRLELLEHSATSMESQSYIRFMEENGVEHVASYMRWVYFRRKSKEGAFDLFSDIDSRLRHGVRLFRLWLGLMLAELIIGLTNIGLFVSHKITGAYNPMIEFNLGIGCFVCVVGVFFLALTIREGQRVARMKRDRVLME